MNKPPIKNPSETYESYFVPAMFLPWSTILIRHAAPQLGERVLDVACGTGIVARQVAPLVGPRGQVAAVDMSPEMIAKARDLPKPSGAAITWDQGNAMSLPFAGSSFDIVLCQHGLQFFLDRAVAVKEMRRVLAPGGRALVMVLQSLEKHPVFAVLMRSVSRHLSMPIADVMTPFALPDANELRNLFEAAEFKRVDIIPESTTVQFPDPEQFVPLAVASSAAAVPAFALLEEVERKSLIESVQKDVKPTISKFSDTELVKFSMFAHLAIGTV
jgi:ubiquinone/menaquinone biosynthesis C-methylase UbiE